MAQLWNVLIGVAYFVSLAVLYVGFRRDPEKEKVAFRPRDLIVGRRTMQESSRKQLLIEGFFGLALATAAAIYRWM